MPVTSFEAAVEGEPVGGEPVEGEPVGGASRGEFLKPIFPGMVQIVNNRAAHTPGHPLDQYLV
jgi:hypothetical protein